MTKPLGLRPIQKPESIVLYYALCHSIFTLLVGSFEAVMVIKLTGSLSSYIALNIVMYVLIFVFFALGLFTARSGKITRNFKLDLGIQALLGALVIALFTNLGSFLSLALIFLLKGMSEGLFGVPAISQLFQQLMTNRGIRGCSNYNPSPSYCL